MAKFGELIKSEVPVLIYFYSGFNNQNEDIPLLRDVAASIGDKGKVIKIDIEKNEVLANALRIKGSVTHIIYKESEMKWRQRGELSVDELLHFINPYL